MSTIKLLPSIVTDPGLPKFQRAFLDWVSSDVKNAWVQGDGVDVYFRKARHMIEGEMVHVLDVANIDVAKRYQRKGSFTRLLPWIEHYSPYSIVRIENVLMPWFNEWLQRNGYVVIRDDVLTWHGLPASLYKRVRERV